MRSFGFARSGATVATAAAMLLHAALPAQASEKVVYSFKGESVGDGIGPEAGLIYVGGKLYGTTFTGGDRHYNAGTVFSVTLAGVEKVVYSFEYSFNGNPDGTAPVAGLINVGGKLYGATEAGGDYGAGTVFSVTPTGIERVVYSFKGEAVRGIRDGYSPRAGLINVGGKLYGTTEAGGDSIAPGTVFSVTPAGVGRVVYSFKGEDFMDGEGPAAGLIYVGGELYGTTYEGGDPARGSNGTVFSVTPAGVEKVVYSFGRSTRDGGVPVAGLIYVGGKLYGTTYGGGDYGAGTVFSVTPAGVEKVVHSFKGIPDGETPRAGLIYVGGKLYGTTFTGGDYGAGTVFSVTPY